MNYLNEKLSRWFICEFKKLRYGYIVRAIYALTLTVQKNPNLFVNWGMWIQALHEEYQLNYKQITNELSTESRVMGDCQVRFREKGG